MKKLSVLVALVLLAAAGTGYAVTCAYDNVPAATLLVPYWKVSLNGPGFPIPTGGTDTLVSITNVSTPGLIAHVTVWNKYSKAVIDFNLPLTGKDTVSFSMRDIMNGKLSPNLTQTNTVLYPVDPCGLVNPGAVNALYQPDVGFGQTQFIRFSHPEAVTFNPQAANDINLAISQYNLTNADAIGPAFRKIVWGSLDQSGDVTSFSSPGSIVAGNVLDSDNPQCPGWNGAGSDAAFKDALSGYLTIDVVNFCTNFFPDDGQFYTEDAIATTGWSPANCVNVIGDPNECHTPNALIGDVFYVDSASQSGNISGDQAVPVEFDSRLTFSGTAAAPGTRTFFGKFVSTVGAGNCAAEATAAGCQNVNVPVDFRFGGDGREPLGDRYGFRFLADTVNNLQSWITVWRSDMYLNDAHTAFNEFNLCNWANPGAPGGRATGASNKGASGSGLYDTLHQLQVRTFDNDENEFGGVGVPPGPSGNRPPVNTTLLYVFLESQRIALSGTDFNPQPFTGGWVDMTLHGSSYTGTTLATGLYNQAFVGVQHTAPGAFVSVGHAAANLNNQFQCQPQIFTQVGNTVVNTPAP